MSRAPQPHLGLTPPSNPPRSTMEDAAVYIRRLIFDGELKAGIRVPQDELAAALGRSRVPVREALIALEREGWVTMIPQRGAYVSTLTSAAIRDHYEMLGFVYGLAARRVVEHDLPEVDDKLASLGRDLRD